MKLHMESWELPRSLGRSQDALNPLPILIDVNIGRTLTWYLGIYTVPPHLSYIPKHLEVLRKASLVTSLTATTGSQRRKTTRWRQHSLTPKRFPPCQYQQSPPSSTFSSSPVRTYMPSRFQHSAPEPSPVIPRL